MELALYCPVFGYYEAEGDRIGRRGDYYTSVSVGSLFGELLACQFAEWAGDGPVRWIEAGGHRGELAKDILLWLEANRPALFERLEYILVEPSERRRDWQQATLAAQAPNISWVGSLRELSNRSCAPDLVFSNELLDSMPVHRLGWNAKQKTWFEWGVGLEHERFVWHAMEIESQTVLDLLQGSGFAQLLSPESSLSEILPDGFTLDLCPTAVEWWWQAAGALQKGKLLAIDYGLTAQELLRPERAQGTLRAYYRHSVSAELLANPGLRDLTGHVNFSALQTAGEAAGLKTEAFVSQEHFLTSIAARTWSGKLAFDQWTAERKRQFQALTHPEHLGRAFRVLVQSREPR
jgi:SAM-dependent MidA family methyltransferase